MNKYFKLIVIGIVILFLKTKAQAQAPARAKPVIDSTTFDKWRGVSDCQVAKNGSYAAYILPDLVSGITSLYLVTIKTGRKQSIGGIDGRFSFSANSRYLFYQRSDSLFKFDLNNKITTSENGISSFTLKKVWLALYHNDKSLVLENTNNGRTYHFKDAANYLLSQEETLSVVRQKINRDSDRLVLQNLQSGKQTYIWNGGMVSQICFDKHDKQIAFLAKVSDKSSTGYALYNCPVNGAAQMIVNDGKISHPGFVVADREIRYSSLGDKILFQLTPAAKPTPPLLKDPSSVVIWKYDDPVIQYTQKNALGFSDNGFGLMQSNFTKPDFYEIASISSGKIIDVNQFKGGFDHLISLYQDFENYMIIATTPQFNYGKRDPNYKSVLINLNTGINKTIPTGLHAYYPILSPCGKYAIWFDFDSLGYFSYETATGIIRNITRIARNKFYNVELAKERGYASAESLIGYSVLGYEENDQAIYIKDKYDIWRIDLKGAKKPINVTCGIGAVNKVAFDFEDLNENLHDKIIRAGSSCLLKAVNLQNKDEGYWEVDLSKGTPPKQLNMAPFKQFINGGGTQLIGTPADLITHHQGKNTIFLLQRMSADNFQNYWISKDLRSFKPITDFQPQKAYNWLTDSLVNWKLPDGTKSQGILYKPENFDPHKKYPVIFSYYFIRSDKLHQFIEPTWTRSEIEIPYYVSNGYLVFVPDIHYTKSDLPQSMVNSVESAAHYLAKLPYVDSTKMGINGHSFGGWETNCLVTHSHMFAAACSNAGPTDLVSCYYTGNETYQYYYEDQFAVPAGWDATPLTKPNFYLENSPIWAVKNVTTPILLIDGDQDQATPITQAEEFYNALRREQKKCWFLDYEKSGHGEIGNDVKDLTVRMKQFFDYYLKGAPPPLWMTKGIPYDQRKYDDGLNYDTTGAKP